MKVYIVISPAWACNGVIIEEVFDSKQNAEKYIKDNDTFKDMEIEEWEVSE